MSERTVSDRECLLCLLEVRPSADARKSGAAGFVVGYVTHLVHPEDDEMLRASCCQEHLAALTEYERTARVNKAMHEPRDR